MIVCQCNALREQELLSAYRPTVKSAAQWYACVGCELQCGRCASYVECEMLQRVQASA